MNYAVEVVPYSPTWPQMFSIEAALIKEALRETCLTVHHIGSTSVPGLCAKPIIDILPVVKDIQEVRAVKMEKLGYEAKGEHGIAFRRYFQKGDPVRTHNVHVYEEGDPEISRYLKFRDWMRAHDKDAVAYGSLKRELAKKFPDDILKYCFAKDAFVATIDAKDGFQGWRMVKALTDLEWEAVHAWREECFVKSDPLVFTFEQKEHIHFIFYKNAKIVGYAHLQLRFDQTAILRLIIVGTSYRNLGIGKQFLALCERWLFQQGVKVLHVVPSNDALKFFTKNGYISMSLEDPVTKRRTTSSPALGKVLKR